MRKWTKEDAVREFVEHYMPHVRAQEARWGNGVDGPLRRETWNNYTDGLCKDGLITDHQYNTWTHPSICG